MKSLGIFYLSAMSVLTGGMGLVILWRRLDLWIQGSWAKGEFVRWEIRGLTRKYYYPVISFELPDGSRHEFVGGPGGSTAVKKESYAVLYPAGQPERAMVFSFLAYWAAVPAFFILSAGALIAALHQ